MQRLFEKIDQNASNSKEQETIFKIFNDAEQTYKVEPDKDMCTMFLRTEALKKENGNFTRAREILDEMQDKEFYPTIEDYNAVLNLLVHATDFTPNQLKQELRHFEGGITGAHEFLDEETVDILSIGYHKAQDIVGLRRVLQFAEYSEWPVASTISERFDDLRVQLLL